MSSSGPRPWSKLAERFGVSGNGLKKICDRLEVPYPSLGHWAKKAAGHDVPTKPLPKPGPDVPASVTITPSPAPPAAPAIAPEAQATIDALKAEIGPEATEQTLLKPHAIIAAWRKELDKDRRAAKRGAWNDPGESTEMHERQFRVLDVILKALAARKIRISKERGNQFVAELGEEKLEFGLRERQRKTMTRRSAEERHHAFPGEYTYRDDMEGTGRLVFTIKHFLLAICGANGSTQKIALWKLWLGKSQERSSPHFRCSRRRPPNGARSSASGKLQSTSGISSEKNRSAKTIVGAASSRSRGNGRMCPSPAAFSKR